MNIGVLDYGAGNLKNVCRAIEHLGYKYSLVSKSSEIENVDKLIIPGVGAFRVAMQHLTELGLVEPIKKFAEDGISILGICLGMQLLFENSTEHGKSDGLGLLKGTVNIIPSVGFSGNSIKVPHIGWNELVIDNATESIVKGLESDDAVYFVHSYRAENYEDSTLVAHCKYDGHVLPAIVRRRNIVGCQFHPEKSGEIGLKILRSFLGEIE